MKLLPKFLVATVLFAGGYSIPVRAQQESEEKSDKSYVEVLGTASKSVDADEAIWTVTLRGEGDPLEAATKALAAAETYLEEGLKSIDGLPENALRLSSMESGKIYEYIDRRQVMKGYFAQRVARISLKDLKLRPALEKVLLGHDLLQVNSVELRTSRQEEMRKEVLSSAVKVAREKAAIMAEGLELDLGMPVLVREESSSQPFSTRNTNNIAFAENRIEMPAFGSGMEGAEFEQIRFTISVYAKFELE